MDFKTTESHSIWICQAEPIRGDLLELLDEVTEATIGEWTIHQREDQLEFGDLALLWYSGDDGEQDAGIYAVARLTGSIFHRPTSRLGSHAVPVRYEVIPEEPVTAEDLEEAEVLPEMKMLTETRGANFQLRESDWLELKEAFPQLAVQRNRPVERTIIPPSRREEFANLIDECFSEYGWREHIERYREAREEGRQNWEEVEKARESGTVPVDPVLERLLPYKDTASAREQERWTHPAHIVSADVKTMYENAGWVDPEDWQNVVTALVEFVTVCVEAPSELSEACRHFADSPFSTGFQTATLSPILNALRPDRYVMFNNKSVEVVDYFTGLDSDTRIRNYPRSNELVWRMTRELGSVLDPPENADSVRREDVFDVFTHWLVDVSDVDMSGPDTEYWKISPGRKARFWDVWRERDFASIGWNELGDLRGVDRNEFESERDALVDRREEYTESALNQVWKFSRIQPGDVVVANAGISEVVGLGRVTGHYYYVEKEDGHEYRHRLPVDWFDVRRRHVDRPGWRRTLIKLDESAYETIRDAELIDEKIAESKEVKTERSIISRHTAPLEDAKNVIFRGPVGTGKTHATRRHAVELCLRPDSGLASKAIETEYRRLRREGRIEFVTFHRSYSYDEFIESVGGGADRGAAFQSGLFKRLAERAILAGVQPRLLPESLMPDMSIDELEGAERRHFLTRLLYESEGGEAFLDFDDVDDYVLIIDEINRADVEAVFGEALTLIEPTKRLTESDELVVRLSRSSDAFAVPPNLHLLGTMNSADRTKAVTDPVLRRRFSFEDFFPEQRVLIDRLDERVPDEIAGGKEAFINLVAALFRNLNARMRLLYDEDHQFGHAYFLKINGWMSLRAVFLDTIIPLLREYFHGSWRRVCLALGCPYSEDGSARRTDEEIRDGRKYDSPIISAWTLPERELLGVEFDDHESPLDYVVTPDFEEGQLEPSELRPYFEGVLSGEHRKSYRNHEFYEEAPS